MLWGWFSVSSFSILNFRFWSLCSISPRPRVHLFSLTVVSRGVTEPGKAAVKRLRGCAKALKTLNPKPLNPLQATPETPSSSSGSAGFGFG